MLLFGSFKKKNMNRGSGIAEMIVVIAVVLIVAAFVMIPSLRNFANNIITALNNWWTNTVSTKIFPTS